MKAKETAARVIGLDVHPDSFAGAILEGRDPATARVVQSSTRVELRELERWATEHARSEDVLVLEASGNAFAVAERLRGLGLQVQILDSHQAGKVGKVYCANDRVDAVKIARIYLSGLSALVWQPDARTRERREVFSAYQAVVKESTRLQQQLKSMLNEHCVRLPKGFRLTLPGAISRLGKVKEWSAAQRMLLEQLHSGLVAARARRSKLRQFMAKEALEEESGLFRLARLCGISLVTMHGLSAAIGDITRFSQSKKLVAYLGLNPSVCQSGKFEGSTALKRHGKGPLRALLIQSAKKLLQVENPLQKWGLAVAARRGRNKACVAVARKLCVAIWHLLMGHPIGALEPVARLSTKLAKLATELGLPEIKAQGYQSKTSFIERKLYLLQSYP